ncbi:MAG: polysaccharide deacetylase family protein [Firmicutes bacterium]|nr:polysaccharide deacetylase family protein [Bacillota bacterium]MCL1953656.1 polysaccharide deacetylase family protein [Bacillota bacterium]
MTNHVRRVVVVLAICSCCIVGIIFHDGNIFVLSTNKISVDNVGTVVPIIMYHNISNHNPSKFVVTPKQLEQDLSYIKDMGFNPIFASDIVNYVQNSVPLPPKPIVLTFDDGYRNLYQFVMPLIQQYQFKIVVNIIGKQTEQHLDDRFGKPANAHLDYIQLREMVDSELVEIGCHTYDMHKWGTRRGIAMKRGESIDDYKKALKQDNDKYIQAVNDKLDIVSTTFAFPFGRYSNTAKQELASMGYNVAFTCIYNINCINQDTDLMELNRFNRPSGPSSREFFDAIQSVIDDTSGNPINEVLKYKWWKE